MVDQNSDYAPGDRLTINKDIQSELDTMTQALSVINRSSKRLMNALHESLVNATVVHTLEDARRDELVGSDSDYDQYCDLIRGSK